MVAANSEEGATYGLFGTLAPGAVIENFSFDTGCSFTVASTAGSSNGVVAGLVYDATVRDITSSAPMHFPGCGGQCPHHDGPDRNGLCRNSQRHDRQREQQRHDHGRKPRQQYRTEAPRATTSPALRDSPPTTGLRSRKSSSPTASTTATSPPRQDAPSGIVAAANRYTQLANCVNHGKQLNTCPKNDAGRLGNIACNMGAGSSMIGCSNYGDLTSTTGSRCGGITSAAGDATFENCANYGTILTDSPYRGVFWGYNNAVAQWTDCTAGGKGRNLQRQCSRFRLLCRCRASQLPGETRSEPIDPYEYRLPNRKLGRRKRGRRRGTAHSLHRQQFYERCRGASARHSESHGHRQGEDDTHVLRRAYGSRIQQRLRHRERLPLLRMQSGSGRMDRIDEQDDQRGSRIGAVGRRDHPGTHGQGQRMEVDLGRERGFAGTHRQRQVNANRRHAQVLLYSVAGLCRSRTRQLFATDGDRQQLRLVADGHVRRHRRTRPKSNERSRVRRCDRHRHRPAKSPHVETPKRDGHDPRRVPTWTTAFRVMPHRAPYSKN